MLCHFDDSIFTIKDFDGGERQRLVYILVFQSVSYLRDRINKVCETFQGKIFTLPDDGQSGPQPFRRVMKDLKSKIQSIFNLIDITKQQMKEYLL